MASVNLRRRVRPTTDQLQHRDDVAEAIEIRKASTAELAVLKEVAPLFTRMTSPLILRQGKNHYIELLYQHIPRSPA